MLALLLVVIVSCKPKETINGKWRLTKIDYNEHLKTLDTESRAAFEEILAVQAEMIDLTFFNFLEDSVLQVITPKKSGEGQIMQIEKWGASKNFDSLYFVNSEIELFLMKKVALDTLVLFSDAPPKRILTLVKSN